MRTTIDLPDGLYRALKARAAMNGAPLRELVQRLIEQGLRVQAPSATAAKRRPQPVIIPARGIPIPALSKRKRARIDEVEDAANYV